MRNSILMRNLLFLSIIVQLADPQDPIWLHFTISLGDKVNAQVTEALHDR
jgi:hypothetical protein